MTGNLQGTMALDRATDDQFSTLNSLSRSLPATIVFNIGHTIYVLCIKFIVIVETQTNAANVLPSIKLLLPKAMDVFVKDIKKTTEVVNEC